MYVGMSEVHRERDDLPAATRPAAAARSWASTTGCRRTGIAGGSRWPGYARLKEIWPARSSLLNEAERLYMGDMFPNVRPVPALKARVWIAQGRLGEALGWAREQGLSVDDDLSYLREFEHITLARLLLARSGRAGLSTPFTRRPGSWSACCWRRKKAGGRDGSSRSWCCGLSRDQRLGDIPAALACLERAVALAEPEGYVRVFADEGPPMASLLRALAKRGTAGNYVRRLLAAMGGTGHDSPVNQALIEPLSERELDVLRLLGTDLNGPAIARELMVSLNTVRTHTKNIYAKLAVTSRRAAVRRGAELGLSREPVTGQP